MARRGNLGKKNRSFFEWIVDFSHLTLRDKYFKLNICVSCTSRVSKLCKGIPSKPDIKESFKPFTRLLFIDIIDFSVSTNYLQMNQYRKLLFWLNIMKLLYSNIFSIYALRYNLNPTGKFIKK